MLCYSNLACYEGEQCAPRHLDIPIREHTNHERYKLCGDNSCFPQYDIALLTLDKIATLSDFIRPLCLPELDTIQEETNLVVTGWGNTETQYEVFKQGDILQKLDLQTGTWGTHEKTCFLKPFSGGYPPDPNMEFSTLFSDDFPYHFVIHTIFLSSGTSVPGSVERYSGDAG